MSKLPRKRKKAYLKEKTIANYVLDQIINKLTKTEKFPKRYKKDGTGGIRAVEWW